MSIKSKSWLVGAMVALLASGAPGFVAPSMMNTAVAQNQTITGTVVDEFGDPILGANIRVVGTTEGAVTDIDGKFSVNAKSGAKLEVSFIGYASQTVNAAPGITVTLREDAQSLDDVVVVGYGVQKKKLVTGATVQVKGDDIAKLNTTSALGAMASSTPGVQISQSSTQPGKGFKVNIRGIGTIGDSAPLYVIDGVVSSQDGFNGINPNDIESIDVLKDAASAAIYGAEAGNGVVMVTTKKGKTGEGKISYSFQYAIQSLAKHAEMMEGKEYLDYMVQAGVLQKAMTDTWDGTVTN